MTFFRDTYRFIFWLVRVVLVFLRTRPATTAAVIVMSVASRITNLLAFLMPLKVILLAGSSGVPRYFRFFIEPDQKTEWIYILAAAAVVSYLLTIILESLTDRLSLSGATDVLSEADAIPLFENQNTLARNYYSGFCQIAADALFIGAGFAAGFYIYPSFFAFVTGLLLFLFLFSCILIRPPQNAMPGTLSFAIRDNPGSYVSVMTSVLFLAAFFYLLIPFLLFDYTNILVALVSFIIIRRTRSAIGSIVKGAVKLTAQQHRINALVFRDVQLHEKNAPEERIFMELFNRQARAENATQALSRVVYLDGPVDVYWEDSTIPGVNTFSIAAADQSRGRTRYYRQHVFPPKQSRKLENEEFLFTHIRRQSIMAPDMVTLYFAGHYQCQVLDYGTGELFSHDDWLDIETAILERIHCYAPPRELIDTCCASAPMLHDRLHDDFFIPLEMAADTSEEKQVLGIFLTQLPELRKRLEQLPLHIYNPDINRPNVAVAGNGQPLVMTWGRWSLEPIGAGLPASLRKNGISEMIEKLIRARRDVPRDFSEEDVRFATDCWDLETHIKKKKYKAALALMDKMTAAAEPDAPAMTATG